MREEQEILEQDMKDQVCLSVYLCVCNVDDVSFYQVSLLKTDKQRLQDTINRLKR